MVQVDPKKHESNWFQSWGATLTLFCRELSDDVIRPFLVLIFGVKFASVVFKSPLLHLWLFLRTDVNENVVLVLKEIFLHVSNKILKI